MENKISRKLGNRSVTKERKSSAGGETPPYSSSPLVRPPEGSNMSSAVAGSTMSDYDDEHRLMNIASFLTLSDATSIVSLVLPENDYTPADSWAMGDEVELLSSVATPLTPALIAVSPGATPHVEGMGECANHGDLHLCVDDDECTEYEYMEDLLQERKRRWAQERLAAAVFSHPRSVRSFCVEAYRAASEIRKQKEVPTRDEADPETLREPCASNQQQQMLLVPSIHRRSMRRRNELFHCVVDALLENVPISVLIDLSVGVVEVYCESVQCTFRISASSTKALASALSHITVQAWDGIANFNPFAVLDAIISLQVNAMGKTSEVLASGIQSVATGVGSASSLALHRLSRGGVGSLSANRAVSCSSLGPNGLMSNGRPRRGSMSNQFQKKLLRKVSTINAAAEVISYMELEDDTGGLSRHAKSRVQRMMHYDVSLRPFVATVAMPPPSLGKTKAKPSFNNIEFAGGEDPSESRDPREAAGDSSDSSSPMDSPFMCTPQSFPPTPASRSTVLARSTRFADDVIFLARDQLRVHDALASTDERTREMARALSEGKRLAVFDAKDAGNGIELSCGQHLATKIGNMMYCSTRSMVPILRNCYVYFEMSVMPRPVGIVLPQASMVTLSIGLSTEEMPPNTLVGAWSGSVGLCTTGQILTAGQWCSPVDPSRSAYGDSATVGCLVCLDDGSAFETWNGPMVTAAVTFNVNGVFVTPPVSTLPTTGAAGLMPGDQMQVGLINGSIGYDRLQYRPPAPPSSTLPLLVPAAEELYPTVTLHSPASAVMCRFSAEDLLATSREMIGAPERSTVYAVDGSVISFRDET